jgi:dTDP-4-amino-4,6-dideoxygalactose transaminase
MRIPFIDLPAQHRPLEAEILAAVQAALRTGTFIGGPELEAFEAEFAAFCGTAHCVGVASGTDALRFALIAAGIGPGDAVITVPNTFIATAEAISQAGATPAFVDVDERTYNMDPQRLEDYLKHPPTHRGRALTPKAVVPVHLYGQPADMDAITAIASRHGLLVIEDACQAHGAQYFSGREKRWKTAGSLGLAAAFSFYPAKNLGACGEAGAVTTNDPALAAQIRMLRDHGQRVKHDHRLEGYNGRLDAIQAAILRIKLKRLPEWNEKRRQISRRYDDLLAPLNGLITPSVPPWARPSHHLYVVRAPNRPALQAHLSQRGISTALHYPHPLHLRGPYAALGYANGALPVAEKLASEILSLPLYPELTPKDQEAIAQALEEFFTAAAHP